VKDNSKRKATNEMMAFRVRGNGKWSELDEDKASKEGRIWQSFTLITQN
jgi:hypothetical protein